jgi:uncharacterized peroxidase-related enzyme
MSFLEPADPGDPAVARLYARDLESIGYVANYTRAFSHRPAVYEGWRALADAASHSMPSRRYEVACVAAAAALRSSYCSLAHGRTLSRELGAEAVTELARGTEERLSPEDAAVARLARKVALRAAELTADDLSELRELGYADGDILDVVVAAATRSFFATVLDATGALPDAALGDQDPVLRDALTVGRPIEQA